MRLGLALLILYLISCEPLRGIAGDTTLLRVPAAYADKVQAKAQSIDASLTKKTAAYVAKLDKLEARLVAKLQKLDPSKVKSLSPSPYDKWLSGASGVAPTNYVPGLDSMHTSLAFLQQGAAESQVTQLQGNLNQSALIDQYIQQRRQELSNLR